MTRGEASRIKVHYKGSNDDFVVFVEDLDTYEKWKKDSSIPMAHFMSSFRIFYTHKQGAQGAYDAVPRSMLDNEFGTHEDEAVIKYILENGNAQITEMPDRQANRNDAQNAHNSAV